MENQAAPVNCFHCYIQIQETDAKTEMPCHRFLHTRCLIRMIQQRDFYHFDTCDACEAMFPNQDEEVEDNESVHSNATEQAQGERILNLYNTNRNFRRDIKTYAHAFSAVSKPRRELKAIITSKKAELKEPYALIKAQYEGLYNTKKEEILQSEPYKAYRKADTRARRLYTNLGTKYNVFSYHFNALRGLPGLRRLHGPSRWRYYNRPTSLIRRGLRLRLNWY